MKLKTSFVSKTKKSLVLAAAVSVGAMLMIPGALAADEHNVVPGLTAAGAPLGLHGVDPVAFVDLGNRSAGSAQYAAVHDGVAYYFSSKENKERFTKSPQQYAPQNGGFCTFGVSVGKKFDGNPRFASVIDGKLYVFLNENIYKMFQNDKQGTISKAKAQWGKIQHTAAVEL